MSARLSRLPSRCTGRIPPKYQKIRRIPENGFWTRDNGPQHRSAQGNEYQIQSVNTHRHDETFAVLSLYVDEIMISGKHHGVGRRLKKASVNRFTMTDIGEPSPFRGMTVTRKYEEGTLMITRNECVQNILSRDVRDAGMQSRAPTRLWT